MRNLIQKPKKMRNDKKTLKIGAALFAILSVICCLFAPFTHHAMIGVGMGIAIWAVSLLVIAIKL